VRVVSYGMRAFYRPQMLVETPVRGWRVYAAVWDVSDAKCRRGGSASLLQPQSPALFSRQRVPARLPRRNRMLANPEEGAHRLL